jgi:UDP-N-acetylglucosamine--N-acetylmuramyl-(pentapeptide) pyrophosphoryl-undecaprenol N-acetylglucosamine transferase
MADPERLGRIAHAARETGKPKAAQALGDLVEAIANGRSLTEFKGVHA